MWCMWRDKDEHDVFCDGNVVVKISRSGKGVFCFGHSIYDFQSIPSEDKNQLAHHLIY